MKLAKNIALAAALLLFGGAVWCGVAWIDGGMDITVSIVLVMLLACGGLRAVEISNAITAEEKFRRAERKRTRIKLDKYKEDEQCVG